MNKLACIALSLVCFAQISCATNPLDGPLVTLKAMVSDEAGEPIEDAKVKGLFRTTSGSGEKVVEALTDESGRAAVTAATPFSAYLYINKEGYYQSEFKRIDVSEPPSYGELTPRTRFREVTLRQIINPVPLIAKRLEGVQIPLQNEWVGYDLELGDWVEPHGKGERSDVLFRYQNEFLGLRISEENLNRARELNSTGPIPWTEERERNLYGNWSGELEISFPSEEEGIVKVVDEYLAHNELRLPHLALEEGYEPSKSWKGWMPSKMTDPHVGYFLRVRVRERNGQILEANYAKINEEIQFDPRGKVTLSYCFNPEVNDRNLEFNTDKNLLKSL